MSVLHVMVLVKYSGGAGGSPQYCKMLHCLNYFALYRCIVRGVKSTPHCNVLLLYIVHGALYKTMPRVIEYQSQGGAARNERAARLFLIQ